MKPIDQHSKWLCPECGAMGVSGGSMTLCDRCDYKVEMVQISDRLYNHLAFTEVTASDCKLLHRR